MSENPLSREELRTFIHEFTKKPPRGFSRPDQGLEWSFSEIVAPLEATFDLLRRLAEWDLADVPDTQLRPVLNLMRRTHPLLQQVLDFSSVSSEDNPDPRQRREKLIGRIKDVSEESFRLISPLLSFLAARRGSQGMEELRERTVAELDAIRKTATERAEEVATKGDQIMREASDIRDALRAASADVGVSAHSALFRKEAEIHKTSGQVWLRRTGILAAIALLVSALSVWHSLYSPVSFPDSVAGTASKLALLALLYYAVIWSARMYRSEQHNAVINQHRHNALRTFEAFVKASGDSATKNTVLLRATESVFSHQPTGFSDKVPEPNSHKILEVFPNLTSGAR